MHLAIHVNYGKLSQESVEVWRGI